VVDVQIVGRKWGSGEDKIGEKPSKIGSKKPGSEGAR